MIQGHLARKVALGLCGAAFCLVGTACLEKKSSTSVGTESTFTIPDPIPGATEYLPSSTRAEPVIPNDGTACGSATFSAITTIGLLLDQADLLGPNMDDSGMSELGNAMGESIGLACDEAGVTRAFSQIVVYLDGEQGTRRLFTEDVIGGLLSSLCGSGLSLTSPAQEVCSKSS